MLYSEKAEHEDSYVAAAVAQAKAEANGHDVPDWAERMYKSSARMAYRRHQDALQQGRVEWQARELWSKMPSKLKATIAGVVGSPYVALIVEKVT